MTGSLNTAVGFNAGANLATGHDNIDIGNADVAGGSNTMWLGNAKETTTYIRPPPFVFARAPILLDAFLAILNQLKNELATLTGFEPVLPP